MFLSFLKSMQTNSQNAQNPGLWVNGNRMPMQEGTFNMLPPKGPERDKVVAAEQAAKATKAGEPKNEQDDDMIIPDSIKARNVGRGKGHVVYDNVDDHSDAGKHNLWPNRGYAPESDGEYKPSTRPVRPVASPQPNATPMQENTNRSMFLTHLQSMQTKSQGAQNPGLWVNGRRMPIKEENEAQHQDMFAGLRGRPETDKQNFLGTNAGRIDRNLIRKDNEEQDNPRNFEDEPVNDMDDIITKITKSVLPDEVWRKTFKNPSSNDVSTYSLRTPIGTINSIDNSVRGIQKQTQDDEAARLAATAKANPNLADRMKQDPRNHARLIKSGDMTQQESDTLQGNNYNPGGLMSQQYFPSSLQETSNKRRADYIRRVSGQASNEANAAMDRRSDRQKKKTASGRGVRLAFKGEDGRGIPAKLLGGRMVKDAIAQDLGVPDEFVYPDTKITADPLLALNMFNAMNGKDLSQGRIYMPLRSPPVF